MRETVRLSGQRSAWCSAYLVVEVLALARISALLVERARSDPHAADDLYRAVEDVRRTLRQRLRNYLLLYADTVSEALDTAFLKAVDTYDPVRGRFREWYYAIGLREAVSACSREYRRVHSKQVFVGIQHDLEPSGDIAAAGLDEREQRVLAEQYTDHSNDCIELLELLDTLNRVLNSQEMSVVELCLHGYSRREIAESLHCSLSTVKSRVRAIRNKLRELMLR